MTTAQQIIDQAREPLNDDEKVRNTDPVLLGYLNFGLRRLKRARADLFIGTLGAGHTDLALIDPVPTPEEYDQNLADYLSARAHTKDDEEAANSRIELFFALAKG
ncbi:hypothetical protein D9M73_73370 [compost metagenome]